MSLAFWALRHAIGYEEGVVAVANLGEGADTNAAVTSAVLGAKYGAEAIPVRWLAKLQGRHEFEALATRLFDLTFG